MDVNDDDHQDLDSLEALSLTDFALTIDDKSDDSQDHENHRTPPSPTTEDLFEFCSSDASGGQFYKENMVMSHEKDIFSGPKLIPTNDQPNHDQQASKTQNQKKHIIHARCESMRELTSTGTTTQLFRNSHSFDYRKLNKHSRLNYDTNMDSNRKSLSNKSSSSRWTDLVFAPLKVPHEMDLKDIRNRQNIQNTSKSMFPTGGDRFAVKGVGEHRKTSWGVLGFLSCRRSGSVAVTMP
ncbi:uncharacterized protein LOC143544379 [Bidens hawaiensis]|uniref:uncharacterized protein LOC143544379 n=1 Tax=Bidens hawaiensis TaxID=980011 RepID=UPI0040494B1F